MTPPFTPGDTGPIYVETLRATGWPVEPWNTASNMVFLLILVYWARKSWHREKRHPFIAWSLPLFLVGFIGGTVYHSTRSHEVWYVMDYGPIEFLLLCTILYFWRQVLSSWRHVAVAAGGLLFLTYAAVRAIPGSDANPTFSYASLVVNLLVPILLYARGTGWHQVHWLALTALSFLVAISFREADHALQPWLPQGSHFLWHLFGGASVQCLILYLYRTDRRPQASARRAAA